MKRSWRTAGLLRAEGVWPNLALAALGAALYALYRTGLRLEGQGGHGIGWFIKLALAQGALYALAALLAWRLRPSRTTLIIVLLFAALFRLGVLFTPPLLSDDLYRYVWDGRVQAAGINPYRYVPAQEALQPLRDEAIYARINRRDYAPTIYPPVARICFLLITRVSESAVWMKAALTLFEAAGLCAAAALLASFNLPPQRVLLFAWHPLLVWEIAGSGHLDAIMIAFVMLALLARRYERDALTGVLLACATLVKFFPVVLLPALYRRWNLRMPLAFVVTCVAAYAPYLSVGWRRALGFLPGYAGEEGLQSGARFFILSVARKLLGEASVPNAAYLAFAAAVMCALGAWVFWRRTANGLDFVRGACVLATTSVVLLSPRYGWYFTWLVPFLCFAPARCAPALAYLTLSGFLLYRTWNPYTPDELLRLNARIYVPFALLAAAGWCAPRFFRTGRGREEAKA